MYPKFIEIHERTGEASQINVEHIVAIVDNIITLSNNWTTVTKESYTELSKLITDSGCNITRKDPRVDPEPLTMEDFDKLISQPVWDVSKQKWWLVYDIMSCDYQIISVTLKDVNYKSICYNAEDLIHYPLYRMKGNA